MESRIQDLLAKQDIADVLARFMRACDRGDVAALRQCYHAGAIEDHAGKYFGDAQEWIDTIADRITAPDHLTTHVLSNILVDVDGDTARAEAYVTTTSRRLIDGQSWDVQTQSRLIDRFDRIAGDWRISHRVLVMEWCREYPSSESWGLGTSFADPSGIARGAKYPHDPVYTVHA
ncbi:nuclear transport factor 2 family protein [Streptosporangium sp. NPDC087985]|uniref:nuclear transport factor 2 family protein n=1 Tax=Streptosporangium sp. NPDC087985 TaxID=3366196 RepID=UPI0037F4A1F3